MRNILIVATFLISLSAFSQETYIIKSGGRIFNSKNERINSVQVAKEFNQEALKFYQAGRTKKTVGNILFWGGVISGVTKFIYEGTRGIQYDPYTGKTEYSSNVLFYVSGAIVLASIPIKLGFQNKIRKSVEIMNEQNSKSDNSSIEFTNLLVNQNGVGISVKF